MELTGKIVVITGASSGLGQALAMECTKRGAKVILAAPASVELEAAAREVQGTAIPVDVTDRATVDALARSVVDTFGAIDIWINNAGIRIPQMIFEQVDPARVHQMMEVNFFGTMYGCLAATQVMRKQQQGLIVNILSSAALKPRPRSANYAATKAAAAEFSRSIREELRGAGIHVLDVYPGGMKTHFFDEQVPKDYQRHMEPSYVANKVVEHFLTDEQDDELVILNPDQHGQLGQVAPLDIL